MTTDIHRLRHVAGMLMLMLMALTVNTTSAQDDIPQRVSCHVMQVINKEKSPAVVQYAVFKSRNRATEARNAMLEAIALDNKPGQLGDALDQCMARLDVNWKTSKTNGTFDVTVMTGQAFLVLSEDRMAVSEVVEIISGKKTYFVEIDMKHMLGGVEVKGQQRNNNPTIRKVPSMDTGTETRFSINLALPQGWARSDSRLIIQPMAIDCQNEDTVSYLPPLVFEGKDYHEKQDRRMRYNYGAHDPLAHAYKQELELNDDMPFSVDTEVVFKKPDKNKTYKGIYFCVLEDYLHPYYNNGGEGTGSCLAFRPFKFLDFTVAAAEMSIEGFKVEAESQFATVPRNLMLKFELGSDVLTADSANQEELATLISELKSYGDKLFSVRVEGASSPEGNYDRNMALANQRARRALAYIKDGLRGVDVRIPEPTSKVFTWQEVVEELENRATTPEYLAMIKNVVETNKPEDVNRALKALPFYDDLITPVLESQRIMKCSYLYERDHVMTPQEAVNAYYSEKPAYLSGKKKFSDGDFYNLYTMITDSAELDTITELAYSQIIKQPSYEVLKFSPYVANRMALICIKRGVPDKKILAPFIDLTDKRITDKFTKAKKMRGGVEVLKNFKEMIINQAIAYFQEEKLDTAQYLIDWVPKSSMTERIEKFIHFRRNFVNIIAENFTDAADRAKGKAAYEYVLESSPDNRAILYSELHAQLGKKREEAEVYVDKMDDMNPKKWYLKGILWSEEAGKEPLDLPDDGFKKISDAEYMQLMQKDPLAAQAYDEALLRHEEAEKAARSDKTPHFLTYFHRSFELQPKYKKLYYNEGNVSDEVREKFPYKTKDIPAYQKKFKSLMEKNKKKAAATSVPAVPAAPADSVATDSTMVMPTVIPADSTMVKPAMPAEVKTDSIN